jgi:putative DNA primase/helicase
MSATALAPPTNGHVDEHRDVLAKIADSEHRRPLTEAHRTDAGNADRLVHLYGDRLRFNHDPRRWHVWDGVSWAPDRRGEAARLAKETATETMLAAARLPESDSRARLLKWALQSENSTKIEAALRVAQSHEDVAALTEDFDCDPWALNVRNGIVDLWTGDLHPHDPAAMHSKVAGAALVAGAACPLWEAFLERVLPDADVRQYFHKLAGYSLAGVIGENVLPFAYGDGANGKSVAFAVLRSVFGDYATEAPPDLLMARRDDGEHPTVIAGLRGFRLVTTQEVEAGKRMASVLMKRLTGEPTLKARKLYQDYQEFENVTTLWLAANDKPEVNGLDEAVWRRIRLLPFTVTIPEGERDPALTAKLKAEANGILGWLVEGMMLYHRQGLTAPEAVKVATAEYRDESNPLREWIEAECDLDPSAVTPSGELRQAYERWAQAWRRPKVKQGKQWSAGLEALGCTADRTATGRGWQGVALRNRTTGGLPM